MLKSIDHIVLTAQDIEQIISFYFDVLGMQLEAFSPPDGNPERQTLKFGNQKINLHDAQAPYIPHAEIPIENGPTQKMGATGPLMSVDMRDPDGNLIEISH